MINEFKGVYRWLSNFHPARTYFRGRWFPSSEHSYQSAKCSGVVILTFKDETYTVDWVEYCMNARNSAYTIKRASHQVPLIVGWDEGLKLQVMAKCIDSKYDHEPVKSLLIETYPEELVEGNTWGDEFYGVNLNTGRGENNLGKLIMAKRERLVNDYITSILKCEGDV